MSNREERLIGVYFVAFCFAYPITPDFMVFGVSLLLGEFLLLDYVPWHRALPVSFLLISLVALGALAKTGAFIRSLVWSFLCLGWLFCYLYLYFVETTSGFAKLALVYIPYFSLILVSGVGAYFCLKEVPKTGGRNHT